MNPTPFPETADIESAGDDYATRFAGEAGAWMLDRQSHCLRQSLADLPPQGLAIDVGGGHAQTEPLLRQAGFTPVVTGSDPVCAKRLPRHTDFRVANHLDLPFDDRTATVAISFRLLTHCQRWPELIAELCRVADQRVVIDYPAKCSVNMVADLFFGLKKGVEKNTRTYRCFSHREIADTFAAHGFPHLRRHPQFFFPMVLHRMLKSRRLSNALESTAALLGLRRLFGSPIVLEARRENTPPHQPS